MQQRAGQPSVPPNGPDGFAGHRKATAALLLGRGGVARAPGAPVSEAMLPVLPAGRRDRQRGRGRSHARPARSLVDPLISPDQATNGKAGGRGEEGGMGKIRKGF